MSQLPKFITYLQDDIKTMRQVIVLDGVDADTRMIVKCHKQKMLLDFLMDLEDSPRKPRAQNSDYVFRKSEHEAVCGVINYSETPLAVDTIVSKVRAELGNVVEKRVVQYALKKATDAGDINRVSYGVYGPSTSYLLDVRNVGQQS